MNDKDYLEILKALRRAVYMRQLAVRTGSAHEANWEAKNNRVNFSNDKEKCKKQQNYWWARSVYAFDDLGIPYKGPRMDARWALAYRRRFYIEINHPRLKRLNDVIDRVRTGILEQLAEDDFDQLFETEEGFKTGKALLRALAERDLPTVARIAEEHNQIKRCLKNELAITDEELTLCQDIPCEAWEALGDAREEFGEFHDMRRKNRP